MIKETIEKFEKGELSVREAVNGYLETIKKKDPELNAYREVFSDAMEEQTSKLQSP